jgi:hypothetical protein
MSAGAIAATTDARELVEFVEFNMSEPFRRPA